MTTSLRMGWAVSLGVTSMLVILAVLPPFVPPEVRSILMAAFSKFCHQLPSRSPHIHGIQLAVCHRCLGIYAALPLAAFVYLGLRRWHSRLWRAAGAIILLSLVPLGLDWFLDVAGVWTNTPISRLFTGAVFGLAAGYYLTRAVVSLFETFHSSS